MWPNVRAALVALHLLYVTFAALPSPDAGMDRAAWQDPTVRAEIDAWAGRLGVPRDALEERLWQTAVAYTDLRARLLTPTEPYRVACGVTQSWNMFAAPHRYPAALHVDVA